MVSGSKTATLQVNLSLQSDWLAKNPHLALPVESFCSRTLSDTHLSEKNYKIIIEVITVEPCLGDIVGLAKELMPLMLSTQINRAVIKTLR